MGIILRLNSIAAIRLGRHGGRQLAELELGSRLRACARTERRCTARARPWRAFDQNLVEQEPVDHR